MSHTCTVAKGVIGRLDALSPDPSRAVLWCLVAWSIVWAWLDGCKTPLAARLDRNARRVRFSRAWPGRYLSRVLALAPVVRAEMARRDKVTAAARLVVSAPVADRLSWCR